MAAASASASSHLRVASLVPSATAVLQSLSREQQQHARRGGVPTQEQQQQQTLRKNTDTTTTTNMAAAAAALRDHASSASTQQQQQRRRLHHHSHHFQKEEEEEEEEEEERAHLDAERRMRSAAAMAAASAANAGPGAEETVQKKQEWSMRRSMKTEMTKTATGVLGTGDIEHMWQRVHDNAHARHETSYIDPKTGYTVFTAYGLEKRGKCCGNSCRHCPFHHDNVKMHHRPRRIQQPAILVDANLTPALPATLVLLCISDDDDGGDDDDDTTTTTVATSGEDHRAALRALDATIERIRKSSGRGACEPSNLVLLATFDNATRMVGPSGLDVDALVAHVRSCERVVLIGIPLHRDAGVSVRRRIWDGVKVFRDKFPDMRIASITPLSNVVVASRTHTKEKEEDDDDEEEARDSVTAAQ